MLGAGAGAGAAEKFYSEPEPEPEPPKSFTRSRSRSRSRNASPEPEPEPEPTKNVTAPHPCLLHNHILEAYTVKKKTKLNLTFYRLQNGYLDYCCNQTILEIKGVAKGVFVLPPAVTQD